MIATLKRFGPFALLGAAAAAVYLWDKFGNRITQEAGQMFPALRNIGSTVNLTEQAEPFVSTTAAFTDGFGNYYAPDDVKEALGRTPPTASGAVMRQWLNSLLEVAVPVGTSTKPVPAVPVVGSDKATRGKTYTPADMWAGFKTR